MTTPPADGTGVEVCQQGGAASRAVLVLYVRRVWAQGFYHRLYSSPLRLLYLLYLLYLFCLFYMFYLFYLFYLLYLLGKRAILCNIKVL